METQKDRSSSGCNGLLSSRTSRGKIKIESLSGDKTCSWVRSVNAINRDVTESSEEIHVATVGIGVQGNLLRRPDHDRHRP